MAFGRKRKRRSSWVVLLNGVLTLLILAVLVAGGAFIYAVHIFYQDGPKATDTAFLVEKGSSLSTLGARLTEQGFVADDPLQPIVFRAGTSLIARSATLKPGQYMIPAHASMAQIIETLTTSKPQDFFINVIPGETSWQVAQVINDPGQNLSGDNVLPPVEGSLLAVRYDFFPGDTRTSMLDGMQKKMIDEIAAVWKDHDPSIDDVIKSPQQMVVLASLVEKETGIPSERAEVASVFINRLRKHMRLQTDPTVIYGLTLGKGKLERPLTIADLKGKTPYNTYVLNGLPPSPIANPGEDALAAVAHPAKTTFLYFVAKSTDPSEGHVFASTYAEHQRNVRNFRQAQQADAAEQAREALEAEQAKDAGDTTTDTGDTGQ